MVAALGDLLNSPKLQAELKSRETPTEAKSRIRIKEADAAQHRLHRTIVLVAVVVVVSLSALLCMWITARPGYSPEIVKWATSILTAIISGSLGVLIGGKIVKSE